MANADEVRRLGRSLAGHKSALTRRMAGADQLIVSAQTDQSSHIAGLLEHSAKKITEDMDKIEVAAELYLPHLTDDNTVQEAQEDIDDYIKDGHEKIAEIITALKTWHYIT